MELLQLKYFCDAAQTENFSRTAKKYMVPVSNISQTVHRLEKELGVNLFLRSANKIRLSEQGRIFYDDIKRALGIIDDAQRKAKFSGKVSGEIKILIEANRHTTTRIIESFKKKYSEVIFKINHTAASGDSNYDFIISANENEYSDFSKEMLVSEKILLAVPASNPLSKQKKIELPKLSKEKFITMHEKSSMNYITNNICRKAGFTADIVIQSDDPYYVRKYVEMGLGIAFVPEFSWKGMFAENVVLFDATGYKRNTYVFYNNYKTAAAELFLKALREGFSKDNLYTLDKMT